MMLKCIDNAVIASNSDFNKEIAKAGYHKDKKDIYINVSKTDMTDSGEVIRSIVHEQSRYQIGQGFRKEDRTALAAAQGKRAQAVWNDYSGLYGFKTKSNISQQQWLEKTTTQI